MGITYVSGTVTGPSGSAAVDFSVDSGAQYTLLPEEVWRQIGLAGRRRQRFRLADGTEMTREIGLATVNLVELGETRHPSFSGRPAMLRCWER